MLKPQDFFVSSKDLTPSEQVSKIPLIPPFGNHLVEVNFNPASFLTKKLALFTMRFGEKTVKHEIKIVPFFLIPWN